MRWLLILLTLCAVGCGDEQTADTLPVCGKVHPCRTLTFEVRDTTTAMANDTNRTLSGMQADIRLKVDAPIHGYATLERVGVPVSIEALEWPSTELERVFEDFTLVLGENRLRASLRTHSGTEFARAEITITVLE